MSTGDHTDDQAGAPEPAVALARVDELLARRAPWTPESVRALGPLMAVVPGRQARVARRLRECSFPESLAVLLDLSPDVAGVVEAVHHLFGLGVGRRYATGRVAPLGLALELWPSRARQMRALQQRAMHAFGPGVCALDVGGHRVLRGTMVQGDRRLSSVGADLEWLASSALRLRKTVLWLDGWRFAAKSLHGPGVAVHYVRRVLDRMQHPR